MVFYLLLLGILGLVKGNGGVLVRMYGDENCETSGGEYYFVTLDMCTPDVYYTLDGNNLTISTFCHTKGDLCYDCSVSYYFELGKCGKLVMFNKTQGYMMATYYDKAPHLKDGEVLFNYYVRDVTKNCTVSQRISARYTAPECYHSKKIFCDDSLDLKMSYYNDYNCDGDPYKTEDYSTGCILSHSGLLFDKSCT